MFLATFSVRFVLKSGKICKNNDHTCFFHALTFAGSRGSCLNTRPLGRVFKHRPDFTNVPKKKKRSSVRVVCLLMHK